MTPKEALQVLIDNLEYSCDEEYDIVWNALDRLEELEKVLKIIKNKHLINLTFADDFDVFLERNNLTETEFNLLKEILK